MVWLDVPYASKDEVKRIGGARWNPDRKSWYLPDGVNREPFAAWVRDAEPAAPIVPPTFAACDRSQAVLIVDMVPKSAWCSNLRSLLSALEWKRVQQASFRRARWRCECCGGKGPQWPVECHERWSFGADGVQRLADVLALCPDCHEATHMGLAQVKGRLAEALGHYSRVNKIPVERAHGQFDQAADVWKSRSAKTWLFDVGHLLLIARHLLDPHTAALIERMAMGQGRPAGGYDSHRDCRAASQCPQRIAMANAAIRSLP
jgi:hypothetical protein